MRRRPAELLALLVCLALVVLITVSAPDPAEDARRRWDDVGVGAWGEMDRARVRVSQVRLAQSVTDNYDQLFGSAATLVIVDVTAEVRREQMRFSTVWLHTRDDHDYSPRGEFISNGLLLTQPGFTRHATLVFEVPADRTTGAELVVDTDGAAYDIYSRAVRVDLGLADGAAVQPGPIPVPLSTLEITP
jgi:hypothetical protein